MKAIRTALAAFLALAGATAAAAGPELQQPAFPYYRHNEPVHLAVHGDPGAAVTLGVHERLHFLNWPGTVSACRDRELKIRNDGIGGLDVRFRDHANGRPVSRLEVRLLASCADGRADSVRPVHLVSRRHGAVLPLARTVHGRTVADMLAYPRSSGFRFAPRITKPAEALDAGRDLWDAKKEAFLFGRGSFGAGGVLLYADGGLVKKQGTSPHRYIAKWMRFRGQGTYGLAVRHGRRAVFGLAASRRTMERRLLHSESAGRLTGPLPYAFSRSADWSHQLFVMGGRRFLHFAGRTGVTDSLHLAADGWTGGDSHNIHLEIAVAPRLGEVRFALEHDSRHRPDVVFDIRTEWRGIRPFVHSRLSTGLVHAGADFRIGRLAAHFEWRLPRDHEDRERGYAGLRGNLRF